MTLTRDKQRKMLPGIEKELTRRARQSVRASGMSQLSVRTLSDDRSQHREAFRGRAMASDESEQGNRGLGTRRRTLESKSVDRDRSRESNIDLSLTDAKKNLLEDSLKMRKTVKVLTNEGRSQSISDNKPVVHKTGQAGKGSSAIKLIEKIGSTWRSKSQDSKEDQAEDKQVEGGPEEIGIQDSEPFPLLPEEDQSTESTREKVGIAARRLLSIGAISLNEEFKRLRRR